MQFDASVSIICRWASIKNNLLQKVYSCVNTIPVHTDTYGKHLFDSVNTILIFGACTLYVIHESGDCGSTMLPYMDPMLEKRKEKNLYHKQCIQSEFITRRFHDVRIMIRELLTSSEAKGSIYILKAVTS